MYKRLDRKIMCSPRILYVVAGGSKKGDPIVFVHCTFNQRARVGITQCTITQYVAGGELCNKLNSLFDVCKRHPQPTDKCQTIGQKCMYCACTVRPLRVHSSTCFVLLAMIYCSLVRRCRAAMRRLVGATQAIGRDLEATLRHACMLSFCSSCQVTQR
jgi:hypothetical protein